MNRAIAAVLCLFLSAAGASYARAADQNAEDGANWPSIRALADRLPCRLEVFAVSGCRAFVLTPAESKFAKQPWIWYAPTLGSPPDGSHEWMFDQWLRRGIAIVGVDVGESYGSPNGRKGFDALYEKLTGERQFAPKACLLAQSRGGLMHYAWAAENPQRVACVAGIYPVCNLRSYPGLANAAPAYGMTEKELETHLAEHNPVDRLAALAEARVPVFHVHGDVDKVVPLDQNSGPLIERYRASGGPATLLVVPGKGHQVCPEFFHCQALVDFVIAHATKE